MMRGGLVAGLAILLASCAMGVPTTFDEPEDNGRLSVSSGDTFEISLEGNVTTGYFWSAGGFDDSKLSLVSDDYRPDPSEPGMTGVGGTRIFTFEALDAGSSPLKLTLARHAQDVFEVRKITIRIEP